MVKSLPWTYRPHVEGSRAKTPRLLAAAVLRFASAVLARAARGGKGLPRGRLRAPMLHGTLEKTMRIDRGP